MLLTKICSIHFAMMHVHCNSDFEFSVSARYCIPQCVRHIAGVGGGVDWVESTC